MASMCLTCCNHVVVIMWCVQLNGAHADECCGRVGVQRRMCRVVEARVVQLVFVLTVAGRPQQRRERWMVSTAGRQGRQCPTDMVHGNGKEGPLIFCRIVLGAPPLGDCR